MLRRKQNYQIGEWIIPRLLTKEEDEDITQDLISIIHCFSARIYGLRRSKRLKLKVKDAIKEIEKDS